MPVRVALAQLPATHDVERNVKAAVEAVRTAAGRGARLVCFPEMGFLPFFPQFRSEASWFARAETVPGPTVRALTDVARETGTVVVPNLYEHVPHGLYYNCSPVIDADGRLVGRTRMSHIAEARHFNEKFYYHPSGDDFRVHATAAGAIGVAICYDRHYPEQLRILALRGCEILLVPLAAVDREQWHMFEMEMQVASFQNQVFSVVVNRVGQEDTVEFVGRSFAVDPSGEILARAPDGEEALLVVDLDVERIEAARQRAPHFRDRRPELYGGVTERAAPLPPPASKDLR